MTNKVLSIEMGHALGIFGLFLLLVDRAPRKPRL